MKQILFLSLIALLVLGQTACSKDEPADEYIETGNGNNGNGNGGNDNTSPEVRLSSSHSVNTNQGKVTGEANITVYNSSAKAISSVTLTVKSGNQSSYTLDSWSQIKPQADKYSKTATFNNTESPVVVCTYTYNGKKYSKEYSY